MYCRIKRSRLGKAATITSKGVPMLVTIKFIMLAIAIVAASIICVFCIAAIWCCVFNAVAYAITKDKSYLDYINLIVRNQKKPRRSKYEQASVPARS